VVAAGRRGEVGVVAVTADDTAAAAVPEALYEWHITVKWRNHYGDRIEKTTPAVVLAADRVEVTDKVRAAFNATFDDFRKFWSHTWDLREVREVAAAGTPTEAGDG
jgi:hypothetical protein